MNSRATHFDFRARRDALEVDCVARLFIEDRI